MSEQTTNAVLEVVGKKPADPQLARMAMTRFDSTFKLEGELVGKVRAKVSKRGGVTLSLLPLSSSTGDSLAKLTNLKGDALEACRQSLAQKLKAEMGVVASRLTGDTQYEGGKLTQAPDGSVGMVWKPIKPEVIQVISQESALKTLGLTEDELAEIQLKREAKALAAKVETPTDGKPENNGEVVADAP